MASTTLRFLGSLLFLGSTFAAVACGSTVTSGDGAHDDGADDGSDGSDDGSGSTGGGCGPVPMGCEFPVCVDDAWECNGPPMPCPDAEPSQGDACEGDLSCTYGEDMDCGPASRTYDCEDGAWSAAPSNRCSPPIECPEDQPEPKSACDAWLEGVTCQYDSLYDCGPGSVAYICEGGEWSDPMVPRCALPPCRDAGDEGTCEGWGCRWLEPGCGHEGAPDLPAAGCFEASPCEEAGCLFADEVCTPVTVLPECATEENGCDACGEETAVCLATTVEEAQ